MDKLGQNVRKTKLTTLEVIEYVFAVCLPPPPLKRRGGED